MILRKQVISIRLLSALLLVPMVCYGSSPKCLDLMEGMIEVVSPKTDLKTEVEVANIKETTVKIVGSQSGRHGGNILTVARIADTWGSAKRTTGYDPQGDPRSFIVMVGEKTASFFGFRQISDTEMTIPDVAEFNGALGKLNDLYETKYGEKFTNITFYHQQTNNSSLATYLSEWGENIRLPVAKDGNHFFHDVSFHTSSIFLPNDVVQHGRKVANIFERFLRAVDHQIDTTTPERKAALAKYKYVLRLNYAATIDYYTGAVADGVIHHIASKDASRRGAQRRYGFNMQSIDPNRLSTVFFQAVLGKNYTARMALKSALEFLEFGGIAPGVNSYDLVEHKKHLNPDELKAVFNGFDDYMLDRAGPTYVSPVNSRAEVNILAANSSLKVNENAVLEDLCERLTERRRRVIELVSELN